MCRCCDLLVFDVDGVNIMTDRKYRECVDCLNSMGEFVKWLYRDPGRAVGIYNPRRRHHHHQSLLPLQQSRERE
jgi:hypothetical protein